MWTDRPTAASRGEVAKHVEWLHIIRLDLVYPGHVEALYLDLMAIRRIPLRSIKPTASTKSY